MRIKPKQRPQIERRLFTVKVAFRLIRHFIHTRMDKDSCWEWLGPISGSDVPQFSAHVYPEIQEDTSIRFIVYRRAFNKAYVHRRQIVKLVCGNRYCLRPSHMELVATSDVAFAKQCTTISKSRLRSN